MIKKVIINYDEMKNDIDIQSDFDSIEETYHTLQRVTRLIEYVLQNPNNEDKYKKGEKVTSKNKGEKK